MLHPSLRAGLQSGTIMTISDIVTQLWIEEKSWSEDYQWQRTLRWTTAGMVLHGPYFFAGFSMLDKYFGAATSLPVVAKKTITAQFLIFPPYLVALFGYMGILEQHPRVLEKIQQRVPETFLTGCMFWPVANVFNFTFVSPTMRVPYVAISAGIWNSYLSWTNAKTSYEILLTNQVS